MMRHRLAVPQVPRLAGQPRHPLAMESHEPFRVYGLG